MKNLLTLILVLVMLFITHASYADRAYENDEKTAWETGDPWFDTRKSEYQADVLEAYVFSYGDPTVSEQAYLEVLNRARMDPPGEADRLGIDLFEGVAEGEISGDPVQPLTFNSQLLEAARLHSQSMIDQDYFSHYSPDNSSPFDRIPAAGYPYQTAGENIAFSGSTIAQNVIDKVLEMHDTLFIDEGIEGRGHRINICNEKFKEVGIGVASGDYQGFSDLTTMEAGRGYWINMTEAAILNLTGSAPATSCSFVNGWNLVGYNSSKSLAVADALASIAGKYVSVWVYMNDSWKVYDPNNPGFSDLTTIDPAYGYWINTTEACTWTLS